MTLPDLSHISSIEELRAENVRLTSQAQKMLDTTGLLNILGGTTNKPKIYGSFKYGLMVYPDIDCDVTDENINRQSFAHIVTKLVATDYVRKVSTVNTVTFPSSRRGIPKGFWIGIDIPFDGDRWGIDCWLQKPEWVETSQNTYEERLRNASDQQKDAILLIKHWLIKNNIYGKHLHQSTDVYDAVLDNGVLSIDDFKKLNTL